MANAHCSLHVIMASTPVQNVQNMPLQPAGTPTSPIRVDAPPSPSPPENKTSKVILPHAAAWKAAYESMYTLLNETDPTKQNNLTQKWIRNMQQHLNITIITGSVVSAAISSAFSWSYFGPGEAESICLQLVKFIWCSALVFSITSTASACQQATSLHRLESHPNGLELIRRLLRGPALHQLSTSTPLTNGNVRVPIHTKRPRFLQRFLWQIPAMLRNGSLYMFVTGLCILVYWDFSQSINSPSHPITAVGITFFTLIVGCAILCWGISTVGLYYWIGMTFNS
ncbi:hypothetical protein FOCG_12548 [Fusarium oxysporum f. sp. radicis-lycopersici 26381]|nr:hypothetical protein FOZG_14537 [Fusarium oxysporum Fo47]EWZ85561.1 hypothetical protein FOWG_10669 [Fusarium oxysporum f. sp. lycopersici MN25]EXL45136.1 hypothetical protein FOCG_12548 [Fusarium oxysporum f. sp. radicis-lycopersici 26381]